MADSPSPLDLSVLAEFVQQQSESTRGASPRKAPVPAPTPEDEELSDEDRELLELEAEFERETGISVDALAEEEANYSLRDEIESRLQGGFIGGAEDAGSDEELLAAMPQAQREKLLALPAEERAFLLRADPTVRGAYEKLPEAERAALVQLGADQRAAFLTLPPGEKAFVASLEPEARRYFLRLNPDTRDHFRKSTPEQRKARIAEAKRAHASIANKPPDEAARLLATRMFDELGLVTAWYPEVAQRASAVAFNHLRENPKDEAGAELRTLKLLLEEPDVVEPLLDELEQLLEGNGDDEELSMSGAAGLSPLFVVEHFVRIRPQLYDLIRRLAQPGLTRNNLSEALRQCVIVSAGVAASKGR